MNHSPSLFPGRRTTPLVAAVAAAVVCGCGGSDSAAPAAPAPQVSAQSLCNGFLGRTFEGAVVTKAQVVPTAANVPEYCFVRGEMPQQLAFEMRLPTTWNKRTVFLGGGGFDGSTTPPGPFSPSVYPSGYATISTNHGHDGATTPGATFALDPGMLADYAYLAVPRVLAPAKAILGERFGIGFTGTKMVYEGCSGGGRQGLIEAQRYPDLFDGVISRAPANSYTGQFLWYQKLAKQLAQPGAALFGCLRLAGRPGPAPQCRRPRPFPPGDARPPRRHRAPPDRQARSPQQGSAAAARQIRRGKHPRMCKVQFPR